MGMWGWGQSCGTGTATGAPWATPSHALSPLQMFPRAQSSPHLMVWTQTFPSQCFPGSRRRKGMARLVKNVRVEVGRSWVQQPGEGGVPSFIHRLPGQGDPSGRNGGRVGRGGDSGKASKPARALPVTPLRRLQPEPRACPEPCESLQPAQDKQHRRGWLLLHQIQERTQSPLCPTAGSPGHLRDVPAPGDSRCGSCSSTPSPKAPNHDILGEL